MPHPSTQCTGSKCGEQGKKQAAAIRRAGALPRTIVRSPIWNKWCKGSSPTRLPWSTTLCLPWKPFVSLKWVGLRQSDVPSPHRAGGGVINVSAILPVERSLLDLADGTHDCSLVAGTLRYELGILLGIPIFNSDGPDLSLDSGMCVDTYSTESGRAVAYN